ncbi:MAG: hypothetical protein IJ458_02820 [Clostridia bacterium]|nr:hypothetical protein [Clostridia bacterium]
MERYIYTKDHLPALKKYGIMKIMFLLLGCLVLLLQSIAWLVVWFKDIEISVTNMVFVGITLVFTLFFVASQTFWAIRNRKIMDTIKRDGSFATMRLKMKFSNKASWGGGLVVLCRIIAILFVILLGILIVSFIQNYLNWGKIILKMPFMVYCAVGFLNASAELRYQTMVETARS